MSFLHQALLERANEPRLTDAGLAANQHDVPAALPNAIPAVQDHRDVLLPADERSETRHRCEFEAAANAGGSDHAVGRDGLGNPLEPERTEVLGDEQSADKSQRLG